MVFDSTHHALTAEEVLEECGLDIDIVPMPAEIQVDCGLAIEIAPADRDRAEDVLGKAGVVFQAVVTPAPPADS